MKTYNFRTYQKEWCELSYKQRREEWQTATEEEKVSLLIAQDDSRRIDSVGGYPTDYEIVDGKVYWASLDAFKEYRRTELVIRSLADFITDNEGTDAEYILNPADEEVDED